MKKFGLIVGNGFTRDFTDNLDLNSSKPLHCFGNNKISYDEYLKYLPNIAEELLTADPFENDFNLINSFANRYRDNKDNWDNIKKYCELRRFLALSYSLFQLEVEKYNITNWKWYRWIHRNKENLLFAVSFNYDLLLENVIKLTRKPYYRIGTLEKNQGIPIIKPHGSIDFDHNPSNITIEPSEYKWFNYFDLVNTDHVLSIPQSKWLEARISADIIPPLDTNYMKEKGVRWIQSGFNRYEEIVKNNRLESLLIIGHSYSEADRPEINTFLSQLPKSVTVYLIGTKTPEPLLIEKLEALQLRFEVIGRDKYDLPW